MCSPSSLLHSWFSILWLPSLESLKVDFENAILWTTASWNTVCMKSLDASEKGFLDQHSASHTKLKKNELKLKETCAKIINFRMMYTVHLLSFRAGIIKSICVKEMTLLLFSFRHKSLLTVNTDLHGHTASKCLRRSRNLLWCLMYLSRLAVDCHSRQWSWLL